MSGSDASSGASRTHHRQRIRARPSDERLLRGKSRISDLPYAAAPLSEPEVFVEARVEEPVEETHARNRRPRF